jgi:hypothetical protein
VSQQKATITAEVAEIGVISATPSRVHVLAFVNQKRDGNAVDQTRVRVTLIWQDSRWLVDEMSSI